MPKQQRRRMNAELYKKFLARERMWSERDITVLANTYFTHNFLQLAEIFRLKNEDVISKLEQLYHNDEGSWELERIIELIEESEKYQLSETGETVGLHPSMPHKKIPGRPRRPEIDSLIDRGLSKAEIARHLDLSRQAISKYIHSRDLETWYDEIQREKILIGEREKQIKGGVIKSLVDVIHKKADAEGYGEATRHFYATNTRRSLDWLINLVGDYKIAAKRLGRDLTLSEIGTYTSSNSRYTMDTMDLLRGMGIVRTSKRQRRLTSTEKKEAIKRCYGLELSGEDIGYMLDVHPAVISLYFKKIGKRPVYRGIARISPTGEDLTYREAYQIYGFTDEMGASRNEIADALGRSREFVDYALEHRKNIEPKLIHALRVMFPNEKITKPYR